MRGPDLLAASARTQLAEKRNDRIECPLGNAAVGRMRLERLAIIEALARRDHSDRGA